MGESGDSVIRDEERPVWEKPERKVLEKAAKEQKAIVLFFLSEGMTGVDATKMLHGEDVAKLSKEKAFFVIIEYNNDRTPSLDTGCPVPTSKLAGPNPSRDYNITTTPAWLVCDHHGNEYTRFTRVPDGKQLSTKIEEVKDAMDAVNKRLQKTLDEGKKALDAKDTAGFLKAALKNFKEGVVGLSAQEETIQAYRKLIDSSREEVDTILKEKPKDAEKRLKDMQKIFKGTELTKDINDALQILKGR
ncbi:MAG: hypothetical protein HS108_09255 [Planctomycetes bacterium]|nr:hypothetical protein [Planctomycetota bacterium]MCL4729054.1 hypothetical protein [Planctomycetota bacterium]